MLNTNMVDSLHWVDSPDDDSEATNSCIEATNLTTPALSGGTAVDNELPKDDQVGDAGNGIPAPLLRIVIRAEGGEKTRQDHYQVGDDGDEDAASSSIGEQEQVEKQEWCRERPVDVSCPVDLTVDVMVGVWDVLVLLRLDDVVVADAVASGHGEVGQRGKDDDQSGDDVVEPLGLCILLAWWRSRQAGIIVLRVVRSMTCP